MSAAAVLSWLLLPNANDNDQGKNATDPGAAVEENIDDALQSFSNPNWWLNHFLPTAIRIAVIIVIALVIRSLLIKAVEKLVDQRVEKQRKTAEIRAGEQSIIAPSVIEAERQAQRAQTLGSLFRNIITLVVYGLAGLLVLSELGFNLGPLIAGAGIAGVAIGFGAQSLVADFLSGIFILMEDQYGVGDVIDAGDATGTVEEVQLRITKIRAVDGVLWFVRNGEIQRVGNKSQDWSRTVLDISISYGSDIQLAKEILTDIGKEFANDKEHGDKVLETPEMWGVEDFSADAVVLRMVVKTRPGEQWTASRILRERIKAAFDEAGIEIPFQQRTIWVRHEETPLKETSIPTAKPVVAEEEVKSTSDVDVDDPKAFADDPSGFDDADDGGSDGGDGGR